MDTPPAVQAYVAISFVIFAAFAGLIFYLLTGLLTRQTQLKKARAQLQEYSSNLEKMVAARTAELQASEEKYRNLFENSREAILVVNRATGEVLNANGEAFALFGYSLPELLGRHVCDLGFTDSDSWEGSAWLERVVHRKSGEIRQIDCLFGTINYGGIDCWQVICRDVTEKRELEAQLIQSQKMAALGQLAAGVAHELNNPLGIIYNSAFYLKSATSIPSPKITRHFDIMEEQIQRCQKIIRDLLNFSRAPSPVIELKKTDPNELLESCLRLMDKEIQSGGIQIVRDLPTIPSLLADPARLTQVFFNFIVNAVQAMPQGGTLSISTRLEEYSGAVAPASSEGKAIVVSFQDTGVGIPEEILPKIFTPFFTTKKVGEGAGLGLSVSYQIIKQLHGEIKVQSELGTGTKFDLVLPLR